MTRSIDMPVSEMGDLLDALYVEYGSRKAKAWAECQALHSCRVVQIFDDGKGHSNAITQESRPLDIALFQEAKRLGYITPWVLPGRMSEHEFKLVEDLYKLEDVFTIMKAWQIEDFRQRRKEYLLRVIPPEFRGLNFDRVLQTTDEELPSRELQLNFAQVWALNNKNCTGMSMSSVPTVIQWLGTDDGMEFLKEALVYGDWQLKKKPTC